ncbi:HAD family hydrolase [Fimbriimonas ginsengisoli]|uniref:HAD-superfamily hydrolase, subfamily IA, variant 1 n=1 Tax=Fimbriimonas ginsengisoli Gsoil 348 TaxID=661478 RepID=A0A068NIL8_FIMGI|nr:HAD family hydrolase [Fimbriimonas ginsengisoli]AIE83448.1 HAD-superfamily hydrolase, subfamily IA, variant 1 [Fimbriimonas ginsengisoli Gsoil 348]
MSDSSAGDILDANASPLLRDRGEAGPSVEKVHPDLSGVKAIYFDLDDTLCGYWDASKQALRRAFELHGPQGITPEEMVGHWASAFRRFAPTLKETGWYETYLKTAEPTRTEQMRLTLAEAGVIDEARALALSETYMRERDANLRLFSDALLVLDTLKWRYPLGLITNGPADLQRQEIATLGIESYFQNIYIEGEMGVGKPKRTVFDRAAAAVDCKPEELLMVGNSFGHDVAPALEYGWHAVWIRRASDIPPSSTRSEEMPPGANAPDAIIQHLSELLEIPGLAV